MQELKEERVAVKSAIEDLAKRYGIDLIPVMFEHKPAPPSTDTREASLTWVRESDAMICIYYKSISEIVKDEFRVGNDLFMPIFVFKKKVDESRLSDEERANYETLMTFINEEVKPTNASLAEERYVYKEFEQKETLVEEVKRAILEFYPNRFELRKIPEKYLFIDDERARIIEAVYVKPRRYEEAETILRNKGILIITGGAHLGKTSMAYNLGLSLKGKIARRFLRFPQDGSISDINTLKNSIILFDDPFGGSTFHYSWIADRMEDLEELTKKNNYLIITSRKEVLEEAIKKGKIGEKIIRENIFELKPGDYDDLAFSNILEKHINYYRIPEEGRRIVSEKRWWILEELKFPHNYEIFVRKELVEVMKGKKSISDAIQDAKEIERACGRWFQRYYDQDKEVFYFLMTLAMFNSMRKETFLQLFRMVIRSAMLNIITPNIHDLDRLCKETSSYVSMEYGRIRFSHPSYLVGIAAEISERYLGEVQKALLLVVPSLSDLSGFHIKLVDHDRICISYAGRVVEIGTLYYLFLRDSPYTLYLNEEFKSGLENGSISLLKDSAQSYLRRALRNTRQLINQLFGPHPELPSGCRFHPRCPYAMVICTEKEPRLEKISPDHLVACHLFASQVELS